MYPHIQAQARSPTIRGNHPGTFVEFPLRGHREIALVQAAFLGVVLTLIDENEVSASIPPSLRNGTYAHSSGRCWCVKIEFA